MKKFFVCAFFLFFISPVYAQNYEYKASTVDEIEIYVNEGVLNISPAQTKDIKIEIAADSPADMTGHIMIDPDRELKMFFDRAGLGADAVINITVPSSKNKIEIKSANAFINLSDVKGSLNIDAANGKVDVKNFSGDFEVNTAQAGVSAEGIFKELDIETASGTVSVQMRKIPALYDYSVEGTGAVEFKLPAGFVKAKLKIDRKDFSGNLNIR